MKCSSCGEGKLDVMETRVADGFTFVNRRRLVCRSCGAKKTTFEIPAEVFRHSWFLTRVKENESGLLRKLKLKERNKRILERIRNGEKQLVLALEYGVTHDTITYIANKAGLYRRPRRRDAN